MINQPVAALVIYELPAKPDHLQQRAWTNATGVAESKTVHGETAAQLTPGVYLCRLKNGPGLLGQIVSIAAEYEIRTHTLFLDAEDPFLRSP